MKSSPIRLPLMVMLMWFWTMMGESFEHLPPPGGESSSQRRAVFQRVLSASIATAVPIALLPYSASALRTPTSRPVAASSTDETVRVPLQYIPSLSAYVVYYMVAGDRFRAILDTGSPFLMVPSFCSTQRWGCYHGPNAGSQPSGLHPTRERFDNNEGMVEWRKAPFSFVNATGSMIGPALFTFGVVSDTLMAGPGGVFLGLVRDANPRIRPSFLGQTPVKAFQIDLASQEGEKSLTLTSSDASYLLDNSNSLDFIPLCKDLNQRYGDPTIHYTAKAQSISANGNPLVQDRRPTYVIFDTGVSGMVVSQEIFDERYTTARKNRERNLWGKVDVQLKTKYGGTISLMAQKPVVTPLGQKPWPSFNAHLIVVGLAFLDGHTMTVDIDQQKLWIDDM